jgi:hypothetical protein
MWEKGISAYIGLGSSLTAIQSYLKLAQHYGYTRLFTSLHIPEANVKTVITDFKHFITAAVQLGYGVTADISAQAFTLLGASLTDLSPLKELGLTTLRLDYGFSPEQIATLTRSNDLEIELNASTATPANLHQLSQAKVDFTKIRACHNYYPRPETGLAFELFAQRSQLFRDYGIPVLAFIPSHSCPRGPIFAGLPTLEHHRLLTSELAAKELLACQLVDGVLFGDPLVPAAELAAVAALDANSIELHIIVEQDTPPAERAILFAAHTNRLDPGEKVIRSQQARTLCSHPIIARAPRQRQLGAITIDNQNYLRYMGEMQVIQASLPPDRRVNIAAQVIPEELFLLKYIRPGGSFQLKEIETHEI